MCAAISAGPIDSSIASGSAMSGVFGLPSAPTSTTDILGASMTVASAFLPLPLVVTASR